MRAGTLLLLACAACNTQLADGPDEPPASVRERLETVETRLLIAAAESAGSITAFRRVDNGWEAGYVDLAVETGELIATADARGTVTLQRFAAWLGPIDIPPSVLGHAAQLTDVRLELVRPVQLETSWIGDDEARAMASIDLELSWSLTVDGTTSGLGAPDLPPVPVELIFTGDGRRVHAETRALAPGVLWSWAGLLKLEDLNLILDAATAVEPPIEP